jgi:hypothetical protein
MFRRRKPLSIFSQIRSLIWPERGFRRLFSYIGQRVMRLPGTPASIASGVACGVFASFTPFLGLHFLIAALLAVVMRGNLMASAIGTFFGNPWTFVPIWLVSYDFGFGIMARLKWPELGAQLTIDELISVMGDVARFVSFSGSVTWQDLKLGLEHILVPLLVGGAVLGIAAWLVTFFLTFYLVKAWRQHRARRLLKAARAVAARRSASIQSADDAIHSSDANP